MLPKYGSKLLGVLLVQFVFACFAFQVRAQNDDPPTRVARLAYLQGSVSLEPAGTNDWVTAGVNRPMTTGDKIWSDNDGRVELQLDGSLLRLWQNTGCSFLNLSDNVTQVQLTAGTLLVRVLRLDENETYEIDTPNLAFSVLRPGLYKIGVNENGDATIVAARSGEGEVTGGGAAYTIRARDSYTFSGTDQLYATREDDSEQDSFDTWAESRDRRWENSQSAHYVSGDVIGYEDLDGYGSWRQTPDFGYVWFPQVSEAGWAPYQYGHWDYVEPWGYTWVDDDPWGFAPFHYGRWMNYGGAWGWVPAPPQAGAAYVRPVYAPALVAWVGGVPGAEVAWFALGPREVYIPSYPVSREYVERVNVSNTTVNSTVVNNVYNTTIVNKSTTVTNVTYVNRSVPGAVVATSSQAFTTAQPVAKNAVKVDHRTVASAQVRAVAPAVAPVKQAVLGAAPAKAQPPQKIETRTVVAKATPPPPPPSFEKIQEAVKSNGGKPLSSAQVKQIETAGPQQAAVKIAPAAKAAATPPPQPPNRGAQPNNVAPPKNPSPSTSSNHPSDRPPSGNEPRPQPNQPPKPSNTQPKPTERPAERPAPANVPPSHPETPSHPTAPEARTDRPPTAKPTHPNDQPPVARTVPPPSSNPALDQKHQQEQEQLRAEQEQERQELQQKQEQEHAKAAQADQPKKQQMEQQHQQQTQQLQQKHQQEQKQLTQKQQQERDSQNKSEKNEHPPEPKP